MLHIRVLLACGQLQQAVQRHPTVRNAGEGKAVLSSSLKTPQHVAHQDEEDAVAASPWKRKLTDVIGDLLEDGFLDQHANVPRCNTQKHVLHSRLLVAEISQFQPTPQAMPQRSDPLNRLHLYETHIRTHVKRQTVARRQRNFPM